MTYPESLRYLQSFTNYEKILTWPYEKSLMLRRYRDFLLSINNPQNHLKCIHVAGTKGKGSTCAFIAYILRENGFKVGLYTSPHLVDFRERIRVLGRPSSADFSGMISRPDLARLVAELKPDIEKFNRGSKDGPLSFFEVYTALAFVYFKEKKVDFAVLETGLGGRLDATNTVRPLVCVITPISYEHTDKLGHTLTAIAREKAGIIKDLPGLSVVSAPQEKEVRQLIRHRCKIKGVKLYEVGRDITYSRTRRNFSVKGISAVYPGLRIRLLGEHQFINAATAIGAVEMLRLHNIKVSTAAIRSGLYNTVWPGRCELISRHPRIVLDGAQNIASAKAIKKAIRDNFSAKGGTLPVPVRAAGRRQAGGCGGKYKKLILVLGISCDKDRRGICKELYDLTDEVILTKADNPRASEPRELIKYFKGKNCFITASVKQARDLAVKIAKRQDLILVTGSLFVAGEFRDVKARF